MTEHRVGVGRLVAGGTAVVAAVAALVVTAAGAAWAAPTATTRISERGGERANGLSGFAAVSLDGRYVTFQSSGTNLVPGDHNVAKDVFVADRRTNRLELVSVSDGGVPGNADSGRSGPSPITPDGRHVAFDSVASNLVTGDTNGVSDVFVRDRGRFARTTLISAATEREPGTGAQGNGPSLVLAMTPDASKVLFLSAASNLVSGDTNGQPDIFVRDRPTRTTTRVSVSQGYGQANGPSRLGSISADGRYVAFDSRASNLVPRDDNGRSDVFIRDLVGRTTTRISVGCAGTAILSGCYGGSMSADGRYVVYEATPPDGITQAYAYDRLSGLTRMVSEGEHGEPGNGLTFRPVISPSGRYVSFESFSSNLVHGGNALRTYHVYVRDLQTATTMRASVNAAGEPGDDMSTHAAISDCGVAFESRAGNLVPEAVQGDTQVYFRTPLTGHRTSRPTADG